MALVDPSKILRVSDAVWLLVRLLTDPHYWCAHQKFRGRTKSTRRTRSSDVQYECRGRSGHSVRRTSRDGSHDRFAPSTGSHSVLAPTTHLGPRYPVVVSSLTVLIRLMVSDSMYPISLIIVIIFTKYKRDKGEEIGEGTRWSPHRTYGP